MARLQPDTTVIRGGLVLSPHQPEKAIFSDIIISDGRIAELAEPGITVSEAARTIYATDRLLIPGLVNAHTHAQNNLTKGVGDLWSLEMLLNAFPWVTGHRNAEHHYLSAQIGAAEMLRKGCTTSYDLFAEFPAPTVEGVNAVGQAYADIGMRAIIAPMMADRSFYDAIPGLIDALPPALQAEVGKIRYAPHEESLSRCRDIVIGWTFDRDRIRPALAPTIPHHCSDAFLSACNTLARDYGLHMQMHVAESRLQAVAAPIVHGATAVRHLQRLGLLGPHFTAAHTVWLDDTDMAILAHNGASVAHNPASNLKLGSGIAAVRKMQRAGINVAIGTDGTVASDALNVFEAMRLASYLTRVQDDDIDNWMTARDAFRAATEGGAKALGFEGGLGCLAPGYHADIVFLDLGAVHYVPLNMPLNQVVFSEDGTGVDSVMVAGELVLDRGRYTRIDYANLRRRAQAAAEELINRTSARRHLAEQLEPLVHQFCSGLAMRPLPVERHCRG
jgi:5-methylthioadenosine/S-adenosylhomocysteine deaminase